MRCLTVRQPWAWAIIHGGKDVENRTRNVAGSYRGPVAIHAGLGWSDDGAHSLEVARACVNRWPTRPANVEAITAGVARHGLDPSLYPNTLALAGAFVGVVDLWAVHQARPGCCPNRGARPFGSPWAEPGVWHLCITNPRPLAEPVAARGRLGLWTPSPEQQLAIVERIGHAA